MTSLRGIQAKRGMTKPSVYNEDKSFGILKLIISDGIELRFKQIASSR